MGKGDIKTKKGKISAGSYGKKRLQKAANKFQKPEAEKTSKKTSK
ncbi:MAG: 30S ribosomal protein THX [Bacteroidota bacterium]|nr:30S ribosomal protein THX [Bacteroidota bacterium]